MIITITLSSGKQLELTKAEFEELMGLRTSLQPVWPHYPAYPPSIWPPYEVTYTTYSAYPEGTKL